MRVVGYCRYSSEGQRDGYSIEAQKEAITLYCETEGHNLMRFYVDEAQSGTLDDRESFLDMIDETKQGSIEGIVVHKLDRFARNRYDSAIYGKILEDRGVKLFSVLEPIIADNSPESLLFRGVVETINEYYSRNLAREVLKGQKIAAREGRHVGGCVPFGFDLDKDNHYVPNANEARIVLEIYKRLDAGASAADVARWVTTQNVLTRHQKEFTGQSIARIVQNPLYIGRHIWGAKESRANPTPIVVDNACEPIVPKDLFERVNALFVERQRGPRAKNKGDEYLLTGVLFCEYCGSHLYGFRSKTKYVKKNGEVQVYEAAKYRCSKDTKHADWHRTDSNYVKPPVCKLKMLPKESVEEFVGQAIRQDIFSPDAIEFISTALKERLKAFTPGTPEAIKNVNTQIRAIASKQQRLLDVYLEGSIDKSTYTAKLRELNETMNVLTLERSKMQAPPADTSFDLIKNAIAKYSDSASSNSFEATKMLINTFIDHIDVSSDHIVIYYKIEFPGLPESSTFNFVRKSKSVLSNKTTRKWRKRHFKRQICIEKHLYMKKQRTFVRCF